MATVVNGARNTSAHVRKTDCFTSADITFTSCSVDDIMVDDLEDGFDDEDIDDDDFSERDFTDEEEMVIAEPIAFDVTKQLLDFAETVNVDIQKFFGRRKGEEDACDIYADKWTSGKSGRELYYADLLRVAQGESCDRSSSSPAANNKHTYTGKLDKKVGLGPLNDLFEIGLKSYLKDSNAKHKKDRRIKVDLKDSIPMHQRKLPLSFFKEPKTMENKRHKQNNNNILTATKTPDFSDLLESWTGGDEDDFSGESMTSPDSGMEQNT